MRRSRPVQAPDLKSDLLDWRRELMDRRAFLMRVAGGSLAAMFPAMAAGKAGSAPKDAQPPPDPWPVLDAVQQHLLPSEPHAPGAREINALDYLRFVVQDPLVDISEREFILQGAGWLDDMAVQLEGRSFCELDVGQRERVLRRIAGSDAGENWLSTLLVYIFEALLTDPVYGGNPGAVGWKWLRHVPGFPRPPADRRYPELLA